MAKMICLVVMMFDILFDLHVNQKKKREKEGKEGKECGDSSK